MIDTLKYYKKLKAGGVPEEQARAHTEAFADALSAALEALEASEAEEPKTLLSKVDMSIDEITDRIVRVLTIRFAFMWIMAIILFILLVKF